MDSTRFHDPDILPNYKEEVVNLREMRHTINRKVNEANTSKLSNWYSTDLYLIHRRFTPLFLNSFETEDNKYSDKREKKHTQSIACAAHNLSNWKTKGDVSRCTLVFYLLILHFSRYPLPSNGLHGFSTWWRRFTKAREEAEDTGMSRRCREAGGVVLEGAGMEGWEQRRESQEEARRGGKEVSSPCLYWSSEEEPRAPRLPSHLILNTTLCSERRRQLRRRRRRRRRRRGRGGCSWREKKGDRGKENCSLWSSTCVLQAWENASTNSSSLPCVHAFY